MRTFLQNLAGLFLVALALPPTAFAAQIELRAPKDIFSVGEDIRVELSVSTERQRINALEGAVVFPAELMEFKEAADGNSAVNFWIEKPGLSGPGRVSFSGVTAGGFAGEDRLVLSLLFSARAAGRAELRTDGMSLLLNDGKGTRLPLYEASLYLTIAAGAQGREEEIPEDTEPPEEFEPLIANDPALFDGQYFAAFSAVDKQSGVDHYEIREGFWSGYKAAESPYLLKDQRLRKNVYVKALDRAGNERVEKITARNRSYWLEALAVLVIILIAILAATKKLWPKRPRE